LLHSRRTQALISSLAILFGGTVVTKILRCLVYLAIDSLQQLAPTLERSIKIKSRAAGQ
jgi:hypothetical protein